MLPLYEHLEVWLSTLKNTAFSIWNSAGEVKLLDKFHFPALSSSRISVACVAFSRFNLLTPSEVSFRETDLKLNLLNHTGHVTFDRRYYLAGLYIFLMEMLEKYLLNASAISSYSIMSQIYSFFMICFISLSIFYYQQLCWFLYSQDIL